MLCIYARIAVGLLGTCLCNLFTSFYSFMEFVDGSSEQTKLRIASIRRLPILFSNMRMACPNCILFFSELRFLNFVFTNYTRYTLCKNFVKCAYQDCNSCNVCGQANCLWNVFFDLSYFLKYIHVGHTVHFSENQFSFSDVVIHSKENNKGSLKNVHVTG